VQVGRNALGCVVVALLTLVGRGVSALRGRCACLECVLQFRPTTMRIVLAR
jgi:hypothetical protein